MNEQKFENILTLDMFVKMYAIQLQSTHVTDTPLVLDLH